MNKDDFLVTGLIKGDRNMRLKQEIEKWCFRDKDNLTISEHPGLDSLGILAAYFKRYDILLNVQQRNK